MKTSNHLFNLTSREEKTLNEPDTIESLKMSNGSDLTITEGENIYREMLEILPVAVFIYSDGRFVYINQEAAGIFGFALPSQLVDRSLAEFVHPDDIQKLQKTVENVPGKRHAELRIKQAKNRVLYLEVTSVPVVFAGKKARLAICIDTTEQKRIRTSLKNNLVFLETLLDSIPIPVFYKDKDGAYLRCNALFAKKIFGLSRREIIGKTVYDFPELIPLKDADLCQHHDQKLFEQSGVQIHESKVRCADGIRRDFIFYKSTFMDGQNVTAGLVGVMVDITELRKVEQDLYCYQDKLRGLTSSMTLTEEFERHIIATNIHEQISQALAVCKMKLGAIREAGISKEVLQAVDEIREIIGQTIQEARSLTFELSPPVLYEVGLKAALEWLVEKFADQGIIRYTYQGDGKAPDLDGNIRVLLFRATRELLFNVAFHSNASIATVNFSEDDKNVYIQVDDDGVGFDLTEIDENVAELCGVGLFSIRERINHLGGSLEVESKPGDGTRVTIVSPKKYHGK